MIINVRGTSGSGKSTLARLIMELYGERRVLYGGSQYLNELQLPQRSRPYGYLMTRPATATRPLFVPGHYETACGGCDTIAKEQFETVYKLVRHMAGKGCDVLFEGLLLSAESARLIQLHKDGLPVEVVELTTPLEQCLEGIKARRLAKGKADEEFAPSVLKNATSKQKGSASCMRKFELAGVPCMSLDRDAALARVRRLLDL